MWRALFHQTMNKTIITMLLVLITLAGQAKEKSQVWDNPTTEYGNAYGDGATSLSLDITKVELKPRSFKRKDVIFLYIVFMCVFSVWGMTSGLGR